MTNVKYKLMSYAFVSDTVAFMSLILKNDTAKIFLFIFSHSLASLIIALTVYLYLVPKKYKFQKFLIVLFVFTFAFFIPFLSYIAFFVFSIILRQKKSKEVKFNFIETSNLFLTDEVMEVKRFFGESALSTYITNKNLNPEMRLKAFLIVSNLISPHTMKFIKLGLSDPVDEIRLLSFSIINSLEKKINNEIFKIKQLLEKKEEDRIKLKLQLVKLNWELIYLNLVDDTFQEILIKEILETLKGIETKEAKMMLIKIYLLQKDYKKLEEVLNSLEVNNTTVPYFLELYFYKKNYQMVKKLIQQYPEIRFIEKFYFIYRLWNDN